MASLFKRPNYFLGIYMRIIFFLIILIISSITSNGNVILLQDFNNREIPLSTNTILVTGFGPFHTYDTNPSQIVVEAINGTVRENYSIVSWVLPIDFEKAPAIIKELIDIHQPKLVIMLGLAPNATSIRLETLAINLQYDPYIPKPIQSIKLIHKGGPFLIPSNLDSIKSYQMIKDKQIPVDISFSAGWYLCNTVFYETTYYISQKMQDIRSGFIHIPQFKQDNPNGLTLEMMIDALDCILSANT